MKTVTLNEALEILKEGQYYLRFIDNQYKVVEVYSMYEGSYVEDVYAIVENTEGDLK